MVLNARPSQRCTYTPNFVFISQIIQEICSEHDSKNKVTGQDPGHSDPKWYVTLHIPRYILTIGQRLMRVRSRINTTKTFKAIWMVSIEGMRPFITWKLLYLFRRLKKIAFHHKKSPYGSKNSFGVYRGERVMDRHARVTDEHISLKWYSCIITKEPYSLWSYHYGNFEFCHLFRC